MCSGAFSGETTRAESWRTGDQRPERPLSGKYARAITVRFSNAHPIALHNAIAQNDDEHDTNTSSRKLRCSGRIVDTLTTLDKIWVNRPCGARGERWEIFCLRTNGSYYKKKYSHSAENGTITTSCFVPIAFLRFVENAVLVAVYTRTK